MEEYPPNKLAHYRKRMKFSQKHVATLLGLDGPGMLSHYEGGGFQPSLERALALEIIYRVPVAFLFPQLYEQIKAEIRGKEERLLKSAPKNPKH